MREEISEVGMLTGEKTRGEVRGEGELHLDILGLVYGYGMAFLGSFEPWLFSAGYTWVPRSSLLARRLI